MITIDGDLDTPLDKAIEMLLPPHVRSKTVINYSTNLLLALAHAERGGDFQIYRSRPSKPLHVLDEVFCVNNIVFNAPRDKTIFREAHFDLIKGSNIGAALEYSLQEYRVDLNEYSKEDEDRHYPTIMNGGSGQTLLSFSNAVVAYYDLNPELASLLLYFMQIDYCTHTFPRLKDAFMCLDFE